MVEHRTWAQHRPLRSDSVLLDNGAEYGTQSYIALRPAPRVSNAPFLSAFTLHPLDATRLRCNPP